MPTHSLKFAALLFFGASVWGSDALSQTDGMKLIDCLARAIEGGNENEIFTALQANGNSFSQAKQTAATLAKKQDPAQDTIHSTAVIPPEITKNPLFQELKRKLEIGTQEFNYAEFSKYLDLLGFKFSRHVGSHFQWTKEGNRTLVIAVDGHTGNVKPSALSTIRRILRYGKNF